MKILIELPSWLGDAVMTSPAIENIYNFFNSPEITLIGSNDSINALKNHPKIANTFVLNKNYYYLYLNSISLGKFDIFISFRSSLRSKYLKLCVSAKKKYQFDKNKFLKGHQVEKYNNFINLSFNIDFKPGKLVLDNQKVTKNAKHKLLGINPGASYGNAKRWYPEKFAEVIEALSNNYDIIIFGGPAEENIASEIEKHLIEKGITNYQNLSNKTSIDELIEQIKKLDLFITGDSGPMHLAAACKIPTVAIFGPTNDIHTCQWMNKKSTIIKKNLECQPCMKRTCPLKHHECMKLIDPSEIIVAARRMN
jgi:heptosyltransferase II